jgi:hypothetical protein
MERKKAQFQALGYLVCDIQITATEGIEPDDRGLLHQQEGLSFRKKKQGRIWLLCCFQSAIQGMSETGLQIG